MRSPDWVLYGVCEECQQLFSLYSSKNLHDVQNNKTYFELMVQQGQPVVKCCNCGPFFESFVIRPVYLY